MGYYKGRSSKRLKNDRSDGNSGVWGFGRDLKFLPRHSINFSFSFIAPTFIIIYFPYLLYVYFNNIKDNYMCGLIKIILDWLNILLIRFSSTHIRLYLFFIIKMVF